MRPIPTQRHLIAVMILAAVAAASGALAWADPGLADSQVHVSTTAAKRAHPNSLYVSDLVYGPSELWRLSSPAFQGLLELILAPTGYRDLTLPFRVLAGPAVLFFLCGMYALLYRQTRSWSVSAYVAVLSSMVTYALGRSFWGLGSLASITPSGLVLAFVPWVVLSFLHYNDQWRVVLAFLALGILGNFHLDVAANLSIILAIVYLGQRRFHPRAWPMAAACLGVAALASLPYWAYFLGMYHRLSGGQQPDAELVSRAFELGQLAVLYPWVFDSLLNWLVVAAIPLVASVAVLLRFERFRVRFSGAWAWFIVAGLFVALGLHGLSQLVGVFRHEAPPVIDFVQASALVMLPLYVLLAQCLTHLFRLVRRQRIWLRVVCGVLLVAWVLPADNVQVVRHRMYDALTGHMEESQKPRRVQQIHIQRQQRAERAAMAEWAQNRSHLASVFLFDDAVFRMRSRRSLVAAREDVRYIFYLAPHQLEAWMELESQQQKLLSPPAKMRDLDEIRAWVSHLRQPPSMFADVPEWYVVLTTRVAPESPGGAEEIRDAHWGRHYRLFRLR
ncbi:MAG: hypothetical protein ACLFV7_04530 [Phycisphaerae bacterium]